MMPWCCCFWSLVKRFAIAQEEVMFSAEYVYVRTIHRISANVMKPKSSYANIYDLANGITMGPTPDKRLWRDQESLVFSSLDGVCVVHGGRLTGVNTRFIHESGNTL